KVIGQALVAVGFALLLAKLAKGEYTQFSHPNTVTRLSFIRPSRVQLGLVVFCIWTFVILAASSNAVNLTDGLDGLASGSSALVLAAYVFISFWLDRHSCFVPQPRMGCYGISGRAALDLASVVVVGLGAGGLAAATVLAEEGASVLVSERQSLDEVEGVASLESLGVALRGGGHEPAHLDGADLVVVSPGVPEGAPVIGWARD